MPKKLEYDELTEYEKRRRKLGQIRWEENKRFFEELRASIPEDTRDLTGRLMGDPLPSRSALADKRMQDNV